MRRSLFTATLVLAISLLGFTLAAEAGSSSRTVTPQAGRYAGMDRQGHNVRFFFSHGRVSNFTVGRHHIGDAELLHGGGWTDVCHHGFCFNGSVTGNTQFHGSWRINSSSHHTGWHANLQHSSGGVTH